MKKSQALFLSFFIAIALFLGIIANFSNVAANAKTNNNVLLVTHTPPGHVKSNETPPGLTRVPPGIAKKQHRSFWKKVIDVILFWKE